MKTISELKREVNQGNVYFEMVYRYGNDIPERLQGKRKGLGANSVAISIQRQDGQPSELRLPHASLIEYDGETLTIYQAGERELNETERALLNELEMAENEYNKTNPYGDYFWQKKAYWRAHREHYYLAGWEWHRGKYYDAFENKVKDSAIKGLKILEYKITRG